MRETSPSLEFWLKDDQGFDVVNGFRRFSEIAIKLGQIF